MGKECESVAARKRRAVEEGMELVCRKRRKLLYAETENEDVESAENFASPATSRTSGCCKDDDEPSEVVKKNSRAPDLENIDLKMESFETEFSTSMGGGFSREATQISELYGDSEEVLMHSTTSTAMKKPSPPPPPFPRRKVSSSAAEKTPTAAELEEFFAAAEKYEQKRFAEKYNYDIVKDVPLEGKYQWVRLQP